MKKYRYQKVTPKILKEMKQLRKDGLTYQAIGDKFNINSSTTQYWLSPQERENSIKRAMKYYKKLTQKQRKENEKKRYDYKKEYLIERYNNDEKFRKRYIKYIKNSFKRRQKKWISEGNCSQCGRERKDKRWKQCERCREKARLQKKREVQPNE